MKAGVLILFLAGVAGCARLSGETILVATNEAVNGAPLPSPPPVMEGILSALFDAGHIVFGAPVDPPVPEPRLLEEAAASGVQFILRVEAAFDQSADRVPIVTCRGSFTLTEAGTGRTAGAGDVDGTNRGKEKQVDLRALGFEIGAAVAAMAARELAEAEP